MLSSEEPKYSCNLHAHYNVNMHACTQCAHAYINIKIKFSANIIEHSENKIKGMCISCTLYIYLKIEKGVRINHCNKK